MTADRIDPHPFLSPLEVGALLHISPEAVMAMSRAGKLRTVYTATGRSMFLKADITALYPGVAVESRSDAEGPGQRATGVAAPRSARPTKPLAGRDVPVRPHSSAAVVADAFHVAASAEALRAREAADLASAEVLAAADTTAVAAKRAGEARAFAAAVAAESVALAARHAADVERARVDSSANRVREAAAEAAQVVLDDVADPGTQSDAALSASKLAAVVLSAADETSHETEAAADETRQIVAGAAEQVALTVSAAELALDQEAETAAVELDRAATATAAGLAAANRKRARDAARLAAKVKDAGAPGSGS